MLLSLNIFNWQQIQFLKFRMQSIVHFQIDFFFNKKNRSTYKLGKNPSLTLVFRAWFSMCLHLSNSFSHQPVDIFNIPLSVKEIVSSLRDFQFIYICSRLKPLSLFNLLSIFHIELNHLITPSHYLRNIVLYLHSLFFI